MYRNVRTKYMALYLDQKPLIAPSITAGVSIPKSDPANAQIYLKLTEPHLNINRLFLNTSWSWFQNGYIFAVAFANITGNVYIDSLLSLTYRHSNSMTTNPYDFAIVIRDRGGVFATQKKVDSLGVQRGAPWPAARRNSVSETL